MIFLECLQQQIQLVLGIQPDYTEHNKLIRDRSQMESIATLNYLPFEKLEIILAKNKSFDSKEGMKKFQT